jgi:hypothetical protein
MELDFLQEAKACEQFRDNFRDSPTVGAIRSIPLVDATRRDGARRRASRSQRENVDGRAFMRKLIAAIYEQCSSMAFPRRPAPGKPAPMPDGAIAFLDFGPPAHRRDAGHADQRFVGAVFQDAETVALSIYRGRHGGARRPKRFRPTSSG